MDIIKNCGHAHEEDNALSNHEVDDGAAIGLSTDMVSEGMDGNMMTSRVE